MSTPFSELSASLARSVAMAADRVVAVAVPGHGDLSGIVWRTGLVVTAEEALADADEIEVTLRDGTVRRAELVGRDPSTDVALLKLDTGTFGEWAAAEIPAVGSLALVVGRGAESAIAAHGLVAEVGGAWQSLNGGRIDARVRLGLMLAGRAEGAAAVTPDNLLIGMAVTGPRRRTIVIPSSTIARAVETLGNKGFVARGYLGASLHAVGAEGGPKGALVTAVREASPAQAAGLAVGDVITTWNSTAIADVGDLAGRLGTDSVGRQVTLGITRGGQVMDITVTIGERRLGE